MSEWEQIAETVGGTVVGGTSFWREAFVEAPVPFDGEAGGAGWTVTLDTYTVVVPAGKVTIPIQYARAWAPFLTRGALRLSIYPASVLSNVATFFGAQDVQIGNAAFDQAFVVKASEPEQPLRLLNGEPGARLRELLGRLPGIYLSVMDDGRSGGMGGRLPEGADLVCAYSASVRLGRDARTLYDLVAETLRGLVRIGSAHGEVVGSSE